MSRDVAKEQAGSFLLGAIISGLFAGIALVFTLTNLGLALLEATVFAALSGFTLGAFVYRERSLTYLLKQSREAHRAEVARVERCIHHYYEEALVCLAYFDAGTLLTESVSPGFLQLFRIPPDLKVRGKPIVDLIHVSTLRIQGIIKEVQHENPKNKTFQLLAQDSQGKQLNVEVTLKYFRDSHMVEAALFASPFEGVDNFEQVDLAQKDLDRFRRGMYRRETRILELKEEVNETLKTAGREPRYKFDRKTEGTDIPSGNYCNSEERGE